MLKLKPVIFTLCLVLGLLLTMHSVVAEDEPPLSPPPYYYAFPAIRARLAQAIAQDGNVLINGDMDDPNHGFYWRPTNHYVAGMWYEWWIGSAVPEFIDGGVPYHNVCYPVPASGHCYNNPYFNLSQGYIRYNSVPFIAGVYQVVNSIIPCTYYRFEAYNTNEAAGYNSKVGIDPTGWQLPIPTWNNPPDNCPPDEASKCPDPEIDSEDQFPTTMVWSPISTEREWHPISVTAEALSSTVSVWTYAAAPLYQPSQSSYWDYTSLIQQPYPEERLSAPLSWSSDFIQNISIYFVLDKAIVTWTTAEPALTQLWYAFNADTHTYPWFTPLKQIGSTQHMTVVEGLEYGGDSLRVAALVRQLSNGACVTDAAFQIATAPEKSPQPATWAPSPIIQNLAFTQTTSGTQVTWDTTISATTQVWYSVIAPSLPHTSTIMLEFSVYLPMINSRRTSFADYTRLELTPMTHHSATLPALETGETMHFVAVSSHMTGTTTITTEVSAPQTVP